MLYVTPLLRNLALALQVNGTMRTNLFFFGRPGREADFLERLCESYGSVCKKGPLALETLRLGHGIFLDEPSNNTKSHYLTKLLSISSLKVLHVYNGLVKSDLDTNDSFYPVIDWTPFTPEECKSLRQLSVTRLEDVTHWLTRGGSCIQELIVTDHYSIDDEGLDEFFNIPPYLSMLWMREKHPWGHSSQTDTDWSDTDSSISEQTSSESSDSHLSQLLPLSVSSQFNPPQSNAFDQIISKLDKSVMTVLDRLPDGGSHLTRLCIALDWETQWLQFSSHLVNLTHLTQLRLNAKSWRRGDYPTSTSSLWPNTNEPREIAQRYAHLICSMCPSLQYIKIGHDLAWEVIPPTTEHVGICTGSKSLITLRELDGDETLEIELFAIADFAEQSGLSRRLEPSDESWKKGPSI